MRFLKIRYKDNDINISISWAKFLGASYNEGQVGKLFKYYREQV